MNRLAGLLFIVLVVVLALTNPPIPAHRQAIAAELPRLCGESGQGGAAFFQGLCRVVAGPISEAVVQLLPLEYRNYLVFSIVVFEGRTISYGVLNNVTVTLD